MDDQVSIAACGSEAIPESERRAALLRRAISLLSRREQSRVELRRKLSVREGDVELIERVVDELAARDYQSDTRFAQMLARTRVSDAWGPLRIAADLRAAGLDGSATHSASALALEHHGCEWLDVAREALRRRGPRGDLTAMATQRRAYALLQRRGFDGDTIRAAIATPRNPP